MLQKSATDYQQTTGLRTGSSCGWLSGRNKSDRPARKVLRKRSATVPARRVRGCAQQLKTAFMFHASH